MTDREAMKMALDYIKDIRDHCACEGIDCEKEDALVDLLRQALAQIEQVSIEPPDYVEPITFDYHEGWEEGFKAGVGSAKNKKESTPSNVDPLLHGGDGNYIKQAQPEQEHENRITALEIRVANLENPMTDHKKQLMAGQRSLLRTAPPSKPEKEKESTAQTVDPLLLLGRSNNFTKETKNRLCDIERRLAAIETQPALAKPEQEPVKCTCGYAIGHPLVSKCICTLRKPWTGLTVDEILDFYKDNLDRTMFVHIVQTIEAKLKEKNI